jgi:hypothetical protein
MGNTAVDRELLLFGALALQAHFFLGLPQLFDLTIDAGSWPYWSSLISLVMCALLAYNFKPHFVKLLVISIPAWQLLRMLFDAFTSVCFQTLLVCAFHELIRPAARDRNLVGQGFADPAYPGTLKAFPSLEDDPTVQLSVVIPVCADSDGLQGAIARILRSLRARAQSDRAVFTYEVILVVCLTAPDSYQVALRQVLAYGIERVRVLRVTQQLRAGRALREGALRARGERVLLLNHQGLEIFSQVEALLVSLNREESQQGTDGANKTRRPVVLVQCIDRTSLLGRGTRVGPRSMSADSEYVGAGECEPLSPSSPIARLRSPRGVVLGLACPSDVAGGTASPRGGDEPPRSDEMGSNLIQRVGSLLGDVGVALLFPSLYSLDSRQWTAVILPRQEIKGILGQQSLSSAAYQTQLLLALRSSRVPIREVALVAPDWVGGAMAGGFRGGVRGAGGIFESVLMPSFHLLVLRALVVLRWLQQVLVATTWNGFSG